MAARKLGIPVCSLAVTHESDYSVHCAVKVVHGDSSEAITPSKGISQPGGTQDPSSPSPHDIALILHTSGTTGKPKAVPLSHENLCCSALNVAHSYRLGSDDRGYLIQVLFHIHGIVASLLAPLVSGGSVVVPHKFDANVAWTEFVKFKCSWLSGTPSALQILLHAPNAGPDLGIRFLRSCSSPLLPSTLAELRRVFQCDVLEAYAMTGESCFVLQFISMCRRHMYLICCPENAHQMTTNTHDDVQPGYVGKPTGSVRLSIYSDDPSNGPVPADHQGEVCISGPSVTRGYLDNPDANASAFFTDAQGTRWFRTGDVGIIDSQRNSHLRIVGRKSEIINRGGEKISPPEVDEAIMLCAAPHVREAACFAVADEFFGQEVEAAVVLAGDALHEVRSEAGLQKMLEERLALFKIPKRIHFFEDKIPKGPTGKIQRAQLAKELAKRDSDVADGDSRSQGTDELPYRISKAIAECLRVDQSAVRPEVTLLELGADSMSLTRLLGELRHLECHLTMNNVMLNPTVDQVIDICVKSFAAGGARPSGDASRSEHHMDALDVPPPFSLLEEFVINSRDEKTSLDRLLKAVCEQTKLELDQLEDVLPLTPEGKWFHDGSVTDKWGVKGSNFSIVMIGAPIKDSVDVDRLKWAFGEAAKVEPVRMEKGKP